MNDIEILEDIISEYKATAIEWKFGNVPVHLDERDIEAIENLIQRNKNLEQIEKEHKEENGRLRKEIDKKDKIINLMAEEMVNGVYLFKSKNQVIDFFTNKVEEDK